MTLTLLLLACTGSTSDDSKTTDTAELADTADTGDTGDTGAVDACPVALLSATSITFEMTAVGETSVQTLTVTNDCAGATDLELSIAVDQAVFTLSTPTLTVAPGEGGSVDITWAPDDNEDDSGTLTLTTNDAAQPTLTVSLAGSPGSEDDEDGDGFEKQDDCDDTDPDINPDAEEIWYNEVDENCDGNKDDQDEDGFSLNEDCDDKDRFVNPDEPEIWYDGIDQNCDDNDNDQDLDGFAAVDECDDHDPFVNPDAAEIWYDGIDQDCDGNDGDRDLDGYAAADECNDLDPEIYPGAPETWYDGIDQNCDGLSDYDQDGDGVDQYPTGADCADTDASTTAGTAEVEDGVDNDCNGVVDDVGGGTSLAGALIITEVMGDPLMVDDADGEWFEVYNTTSDTLDLDGWTLSGGSGEELTISGTLLIAAGDHAVFGPDANESTNGGVTVSYEYNGTELSLDPLSDTLSFSYDGESVSSVTWDAAWYAGAGVAFGLDAAHLNATDAPDGDNWCAATDSYGLGDLGTPGTVNPGC